MSGLLLIQTKIMDTLKGDTNLYPSPFVSVLNRWATEGGPNVPGATPDVWDANSGKMMPHLVVLDGGDEEAGFGGGFGGRESNPIVVGVVRATDAGRTNLNFLDVRLKQHFGNNYIPLAAKDTRQFKVLTRSPIEEGSELGYNGMLVSRWILGVVGIDRYMLR